MDLATLGGTLLPLVGVALGTAGTLTGQYLATRGESRRQADQRAAELRSERKAAITAFLDAVQRVEQLAGGRGREGTAQQPDPDDLLHALWLSKKLLELVCGFDLGTAAHRYASALDALARSRGSDEPANRLLQPRAAFMEAARRELGVPGPALYRSAHPPSP